jgi:hypothetical protein
MSAQKKRCFVVMGFGMKTDYATGRMLDLNKSYRLLIKPVVENKGLECVRADEIIHSGVIDVPMYTELLKADVVIADLSTANVNAFYELGIRHALRPFSTIVISEDKLTYPFDLNHIAIRSYTHLGNAIDFEEVERFRGVLGDALQNVLDRQLPDTDSPVYTFLKELEPPSLQEHFAAAAPQQNGVSRGAAGAATPNPETGKALSLIIEEGEQAIDASNFDLAKERFEAALNIGQNNKDQLSCVNDSYLIQRLAMATYKTQKPDKITALNNALTLLGKLDLEHTNDAETVSLAGAIEKKLYEAEEDVVHLSNAILYFQRGYYLLNNRYNAINLAFMLNCRANSSLCSSREEKIADMIYANYTRKRVLYLCDKDWETITKRESKEVPTLTDTEEQKAQKAYNDDLKFWIQINRAEAHFGLGEFDAFRDARVAAQNIAHSDWMMQTFDAQIDKLRQLLQTTSDLLTPQWVEA